MANTILESATLHNPQHTPQLATATPATPPSLMSQFARAGKFLNTKALTNGQRARHNRAVVLCSKLRLRAETLVEYRPCFAIGEQCPVCEGVGEVEGTQLDVDRFALETCPLCYGKKTLDVGELHDAENHYRKVNASRLLGTAVADSMPELTEQMRAIIRRKIAAEEFGMTDEPTTTPVTVSGGESTSDPALELAADNDAIRYAGTW